jgi:hypothetical protein
VGDKENGAAANGCGPQAATSTGGACRERTSVGKICRESKFQNGGLFHATE